MLSQHRKQMQAFLRTSSLPLSQLMKLMTLQLSRKSFIPFVVFLGQLKEDGGELCS